VVNGLVIFVPRIIKAYAGKTECHIAVTSSWGGWGGGPSTAPYSAAKAAVNNLMESYYMALKPYGIGASALCPMNIRTNIWETERRRPAKYKNTGYNTTEEVIDVLKEHVSGGIDPVELAERFKRGIEAGQVYIVPYPNAYELVSREHERIRNYTSPEGMAKEAAREQFMIKMREAGAPVPEGIAVLEKRGPAVGFAKARPDFDWVDPSHRFTGKP
jgi:NAD(P)-dependent dehydrogenase (short-subunit alcohol dehydrogenase family)